MDRNHLRTFHRRLHRWYQAYGRKNLPWRITADPYAIYVSEIMLQQTQVKTVLERYYFPFLARFPTLAALAAAKQDEVLQAWQGLGYYNRALNLHQSAKRCGKTLPKSIEKLTALPGIGRNTAHAIAAFAYRQPVAVMEANVRRVLSRIFALSQPNEAQLWEKAALLLDAANPFDYNQAMMDIGAMICSKHAPLCEECPAAAICAGKDAPEHYPLPKKAKATPVRRKRIAVFRNPRGHYYALPRTTRFLHGLYHFVESDASSGQVDFQKRRYRFADGVELGHIRQQYSHFTLEAEVYLLEASSKAGTWYDYERLTQLPMSMAERKILALILRIA